MRGINVELTNEALPETRAELIKGIARRLSRAKVDSGEVMRLIRYLHWTRDVANARELLRRFSRDRRHYGRSLSQKRQHAAIDRDFFAVLSVCSDVDELLVLGVQIVRLMPYYAQGYEQTMGKKQ
jgi:hypothetical protein